MPAVGPFRPTARAVLAVLALYAIVLQGFLGAAVPSASPGGHVLCVPDASAGGTPDRSAPVHGCCPAACQAVASLPGRSDLAVAAPALEARPLRFPRIAGRFIGRPVDPHRSARGPPLPV